MSGEKPKASPAAAYSNMPACLAGAFGPWNWPLPPEAHVPGQNRRPAGGDGVHKLAGLAPKHTDPALWQSNAAYLAGHRLYAHEYYWEAHEVWEPVWMGARLNTRERFLVQGLIQLANACLKLRMERRAAAGRLAQMAAAHFRDSAGGLASAPVMAIDASSMATSVDRFASALALGIDPGAPAISMATGLEWPQRMPL